MKKTQNVTGEPIQKEKIFKTMLYVTYIVAAIFLLKNIISKSLLGAGTIGAGLLVFTIILLVMRFKHTKKENQQFVVSLSLVFLEFIISLNSGDYYSDDFPLYLNTETLSSISWKKSLSKDEMNTSPFSFPMRAREEI